MSSDLYVTHWQLISLSSMLLLGTNTSYRYIIRVMFNWWKSVGFFNYFVLAFGQSKGKWIRVGSWPKKSHTYFPDFLFNGTQKQTSFKSSLHILVKLSWGSASPPWNVGTEWTDSIASNLSLASDFHSFSELEIMCSETDASVDQSSLWLPCSINLPLLFHHDWFSRWISFSGKELGKTFARISIILLLCILAQFPKFLDPLSIFSTSF